MILFILAILFILFIYCWHGNEVSLESVKIANVAYECNWISSDKNAKSSLMLMIQRAQRPSYLTAAKFTKVSLESFVVVSKRSLTVLTKENVQISDSQVCLLVLHGTKAN